MVEKITARDARQGRKGTNVLKILVVGLVLAAGFWIVLETVFA